MEVGMPANDTIYAAVKNALVKDGWTITHDPYTLNVGGVRAYADLGAEKVIAAEREAVRIAVEIKSFVGPSPVDNFEKALGQYVLYLSLIRRVDPDRKLYLAIDDETHEDFFSRDAVRYVLEDTPIPRLIVRVSTEEVMRWIG
jgi:hypothetical protein